MAKLLKIIQPPHNCDKELEEFDHHITGGKLGIGSIAQCTCTKRFRLVALEITPERGHWLADPGAY